MKTILISLLIVTAILVSSIGATEAYFLDLETSTDNSFATGTLVLNLLVGGLTTTTPITGTNLAPGEGTSQFVTMRNSGTIPVSRVTVTATRTDGSESLFNKLKVRIYSASGYPASGRVLQLADLNLHDLNDYEIYGSLAANNTETGEREIEVYLPSDADSTFQNLNCEWTFGFTAEQ